MMLLKLFFILASRKFTISTITIIGRARVEISEGLSADQLRIKKWQPQPALFHLRQLPENL